MENYTDNSKPIGIIDMIYSDEELMAYWLQLDESSQQYFRDIDQHQRMPNLLSDTMFKGIFDPRKDGDWLSKLISAVLGVNVRVQNSLDKEGLRFSEDSKGIVLDLIVRFDDESIGIVEIQRKGATMPPQRSAVYSANILSSQYAIEPGQTKSEVDFTSIHPVYTIVFIENSVGEFEKYPDYHHFFRQKSDTGLDLELLQYYHYICLDKFMESRPKVANDLINWLDFLTIRDIPSMLKFIANHKEYDILYSRAVAMMASRRELLDMISESVGQIDLLASLKKTNESIAKKELEQLKKQMAELMVEKNKIEDENIELKRQLAEERIKSEENQ